jgi:KDO2-lipid IV(A) lauroyltransferase
MYHRVKPHPLKVLLNQIIGRIAVAGLWLMRLFDRKSMADFMGRLISTIGPWLPVHRVGRANLQAAYPEKSAAEIEGILPPRPDQDRRPGTARRGRRHL